MPSQSETFQQLAQVLITGDCEPLSAIATSEHTLEELARRRFPVRRVRKAVFWLQCLINAVTVEVKSPKNQMSGFATYQELAETGSTIRICT